MKALQPAPLTNGGANPSSATLGKNVRDKKVSTLTDAEILSLLTNAAGSALFDGTVNCSFAITTDGNDLDSGTDRDTELAPFYWTSTDFYDVTNTYLQNYGDFTTEQHFVKSFTEMLKLASDTLIPLTADTAYPLEVRVDVPGRTRLEQSNPESWSFKCLIVFKETSTYNLTAAPTRDAITTAFQNLTVKVSPAEKIVGGE